MTESSLLKGKKILVVDDEKDILEVLTEQLNMCQISTASNFEDARKLLESRRFDVAILDIMGVRGYDLLEIANQQGIPALMLTAHAFTPDNIVKSVKEGAASYVPKEEIARIDDFLSDVLLARAKGESPWIAWQKRLPRSYFQTRFGAAWQAADKEFLSTLKSAIQGKSAAAKKKE